MIKIEKTDIFGWEAAIRGLRNPMNSWDNSDSCWCFDNDRNESKCNTFCCDDCVTPFYEVGENDLKLMKSLSEAGSDHGKFLRMINVSLDLTAPLYFWKQFDQYKVGVTTNSCSTMHKIHAKEFTLDDFSHEHLNDNPKSGCTIDILATVICALNHCRGYYLVSKDKYYWWQMIQLLPSSYNQKRTVQLNYQVLKNIYHARKNHKLDEWVEFCKWVETLPYAKELICINE